MQLTEKSINEAIKMLARASNNVTKMMDEYAAAIADVGLNALLPIYGGELVCMADRVSEGKYAVSALGDVVCFLEFGTGAYTQEHMDAGSKLGIIIEPGSWSLEHANTYWDYLDKYGTDDGYPYNRYPKRGMLIAYNAMEAKVKDPEFAKEFFQGKIFE